LYGDGAAASPGGGAVAALGCGVEVCTGLGTAGMFSKLVAAGLAVSVGKGYLRGRPRPRFTTGGGAVAGKAGGTTGPLGPSGMGTSRMGVGGGTDPGSSSSSSPLGISIMSLKNGIESSENSTS